MSSNPSPEPQPALPAPRRRWLRVAVAALALVVIVAAAIGGRSAYRSSGDRPFARLVTSAAGCSATTDRLAKGKDAPHRGWSDASDVTLASCGKAIVLARARFPTEQTMQTDILRTPPSDPTCILDNTVYTNGREPIASFQRFCTSIHARVVDEVSGLPGTDGTAGPAPTYASTLVATTPEQRQDAASQQFALRMFFTH